LNNFKQAIPWWLRIGAKLILSQLPLQYAFWKKLQLFEHGDMNQPHRSLNTFLEHAQTAGVLDMGKHGPRLKTTNDDYTVLEIGPGDSFFTAVVAKLLGASRTWLIDAGAFATTDIKDYIGLFKHMQQRGFMTPFATVPKNVADILEVCCGNYMTDGVTSLSHLPDTSVNYCFSNAVLEHVPKREFILLTRELFRVMKPDGVSVHRVDLKDHLGGGLNNLRFAEKTWERPLFRNSGFYTNRIRFCEMVDIFEQSGFYCSFPRILRWNRLPMPKGKMDAQFSSLPDDNLMVSGFDIVLRTGLVNSYR
jgi:hypothetical protein